MSKRLIFLALLVLALGLFSGCEDTKDGPFEGDWVSLTAPRLSFRGNLWTDGEGDTGTFTFAGKYPIYDLALTSGAGIIARRATFADKRSFEFCALIPGGGLVDCHDYVLDKPTLH